MTARRRDHSPHGHAGAALKRDVASRTAADASGVARGSGGNLGGQDVRQANILAAKIDLERTLVRVTNISGRKLPTVAPPPRAPVARGSVARVPRATALPR